MRLIEMKLQGILVSALLLSACSTSEETAGTVYEGREGFVTIIGPKEFGKPAAPTKRMVEQANEVCPNALYRSARPSVTDFDTYEYLFKC
jgi:hypothetical protein